MLTSKDTRTHCLENGSVQWLTEVPKHLFLQYLCLSSWQQSFALEGNHEWYLKEYCSQSLVLLLNKLIRTLKRETLFKKKKKKTPLWLPPTSPLKCQHFGFIYELQNFTCDAVCLWAARQLAFCPILPPFPFFHVGRRLHFCCCLYSLPEGWHLGEGEGMWLLYALFWQPFKPHVSDVSVCSLSPKAPSLGIWKLKNQWPFFCSGLCLHVTSVNGTDNTLSIGALKFMFYWEKCVFESKLFQWEIFAGMLDDRFIYLKCVYTYILYTWAYTRPYKYTYSLQATVDLHDFDQRPFSFWLPGIPLTRC